MQRYLDLALRILGKGPRSGRFLAPKICGFWCYRLLPRHSLSTSTARYHQACRPCQRVSILAALRLQNIRHGTFGSSMIYSPVLTSASSGAKYLKSYTFRIVLSGPRLSFTKYCKTLLGYLVPFTYHRKSTPFAWTNNNLQHPGRRLANRNRSFGHQILSRPSMTRPVVVQRRPSLLTF